MEFGKDYKVHITEVDKDNDTLTFLLEVIDTHKYNLNELLWNGIEALEYDDLTDFDIDMEDYNETYIVTKIDKEETRDFIKVVFTKK